MHAIRSFRILSVTVILGFLLVLPGSARTAFSSCLQPNSLAPGGSLYWNTFVGSADRDLGWSIALDANCNIYVAGFSNATWGTPAHPFTGDEDAFVAKLDSSGALIWNTFLGGSALDEAQAIAVDGGGNVLIAGVSEAGWGRPINPFAGTQDAFVAKLDGSGALVWNTFLGENMSRYGYGIAVDPGGNTYITGESDSAQGSPLNSLSWRGAFVAKLDESGMLTWSTFLHAGGGSSYGTGIALDANANPYVVGTTMLGSILQYGAFVAKLDKSGALTWNTILDGSMAAIGNSIAVDADGNAYIGGYSDATWGAPVRPFAGSHNAFVARLDSTGALTWNTFLGSNTGNYDFLDITVGADGNAYITGDSNATWGAPVRPFAGDHDAFVARVDSTGTLAWNTFLGSQGPDAGCGIAVDGYGNVYTVGGSTSTWGNPMGAFLHKSDPNASAPTVFVAKLRGSLP